MGKNEIQDFRLHKEEKKNYEISQIAQFLPKRGKENFFTINEWDFWLAPSNSQLDSQILGIDVFFRWSVDRITIVGERISKLTHLGQESSLEVVLDYLASDELSVIKVDTDSWKLIDCYGENVAYFSFPRFQQEKGRLDFNPNKLNAFGKRELKNFIDTVFVKAHFSRADLACDMLNFPDKTIREYDLHKSIGKRIWFDRLGNMETTYWGAVTSDEQLRLYNKKIEQQNKGYKLPDFVKTWWRLEFQLRSSKTENWYSELVQTLEKFYSIKTDVENIQDKLVLTALKADPSLWKDLSKNSKTKYRKLTKELALTDNFLTKNLIDSYCYCKDELRDELDSWLLGLDVAE